jgi:hypothetical protein
MKIMQIKLLVALYILLMSACTTSPTQTIEIETMVPATAKSPSISLDIIDFPKAQSQSLASGSDGTLYVIFGQNNSLFVSRSMDAGKTFGEPVLATGELPVHVLPIERPAIAVRNNTRVSIAWLEMPPDFNGAKIWYAASKDGGETFQPGQLVAEEAAGEVAMVDVAFDLEGNPLLAWLNGSELKFTRSFDQGRTFSEIMSIGNGSCECCHPKSILLNSTLHIAYRSLEPGNDYGDIRDIVMIHSDDGGRTFQPVTRISDAHWYLPACPIAGPSMAAQDGNLFVTWMDGRLEPPGTFRRGDIWFATSQDGGKTFSPNIRINADQDMHHNLPTIAIGPTGRIHIAWEAQGTDEAFLYYTVSDDGGQTFASPQIIADNTDSARGNPGKPAMVVDSMGHVTLSWLDRGGVRLATWIDTR